MKARSVDTLSVDDNTLKYKLEKQFDNDLFKRGDNVDNNLELLDSTMPYNNSLMGGSARGNQAGIGQGDYIVVVQLFMENCDHIFCIIHPNEPQMGESNIKSGAKPSLNLFGSQSDTSCNKNTNHDHSTSDGNSISGDESDSPAKEGSCFEQSKTTTSKQLKMF